MQFLKTVCAVITLSASANLLAHGMMSGTYPENGAMMMSQAERVEMHFNSPVKVVSLKVVGDDGQSVAIKFDRNAPATEHFVTNLPKLDPKNYTVHWKAMGEDGHVMNGSYGFMQH